MMLENENMKVKLEAAQNMKLSEDVLIDVIGCARCGGNHTRLPFKRFTRPSKPWSHWAKCPNIGEPVMLKISPS